MVSEAYPLLEKSQQDLVGQGLYFVAFYEEPFASEQVAFGPEDDPAYKYPDKTLYPKGTIKVNITMRTLAMIRVVNQISDPLVRAMFWRRLLDLTSHEIKHVQQYMRHPVLALAAPADCPEGICDEQKTFDTEAKLSYELEATEYGDWIGIKPIKESDWAYAVQWAKDHPDLGKGTLAEGVARWLRGKPSDPPVTDFIRLFYTSMYDPVMLAKKCVASGELDESEVAHAEYYLKANADHDHFLEHTYAYLTPVFKRLSSCVPAAGKDPAQSQ